MRLQVPRTLRCPLVSPPPFPELIISVGGPGIAQGMEAGILERGAVTATVNGVETERGMTIVGRHGLLIGIGAATGITTDGGNRPREIGSCPTQSGGAGKGAGRETASGIQDDQEAISEVTGRSYVVSHLYASYVY